MKHSVLYIPSVFNHRSRVGNDEKEPLVLTKGDFLWPTLFLLCMSATGVGLYPLLLFVIGIMMRRFREDRYDFAIMCFFFFGGYSLIPFALFPIKFADIALVGSLLLAVVMRKPPVMRRVLAMYIVYVIILLWLATQSWESMKIQLLVIRFYAGFISVFIPLAIFANHKFEFKELVRHLVPYLVVICIFFIMDAFILKNHYFLPEASWDGARKLWEMKPSLFILAHARVYPHGLFFSTIVMVPAMRLFKLPKWLWALLVIAAYSTLTFTYMTALFVTLLLFQGSARRFFKIVGGGLVGFALLYGIDSLLPQTELENGAVTSTMRIHSTVQQFIDLSSALDDEDIAEFGSGRMAQAIPKLELVDFYGRQWTGLGFLHHEYSTANRFMVYNEYYSDVTQADEVATGVEIIPIQLYISGGWICLIVVNLFYFGLWFVVRRMKYSYLYLSTWVFVMIMGIGGFASPSTYPGVQLLSFSFAAVVLANRQSLPGFNVYDKAQEDSAKTAQPAL